MAIVEGEVPVAARVESEDPRVECSALSCLDKGMNWKFMNFWGS